MDSLDAFASPTVDLESAGAGLKRLKECLAVLSEGKAKARQKEENTTIALQLCDDYKVFIFQDKFGEILSFADVVGCFLELCLQELDDNIAKQNNKTFKPKTTLLTFLTRWIKEYTEVSFEDVNLPFIVYFKLLVHEYVHVADWLEDHVLDAILKIINKKSFSSLEGKIQKPVWNRVWKRVMTLDLNKSTCLSYLKIATWALKTLTSSIMTLEGSAHIVEILTIVFERPYFDDVRRWSGHCLYTIVTFLNVIMEEWGIEIRQSLIGKIDHIAQYVIELPFKEEEEEYWKFIDNYFSLAAVLCSGSGLISESTFSIATASIESIERSLARMFLNRSQTTLPEQQIAIFARIVVISHLAETSSSYHTNVEQDIKRVKVVPVLEKFCYMDFDFGSRQIDVFSCEIVNSCMEIVEQIIVKWSDSLSKCLLSQLAIGIWNMNKKIRDCSRSNLCSILYHLVEKDAFGDVVQVKTEAQAAACMEDPRVRIKAMWNFALTSSNFHEALEKAVLLMTTLMRRFLPVLGDMSVICTNVSSVIAKWPESSVLPLLSSFLCNLEFDERLPFIGLQQVDSGLKQHKLRCQLSEWLVSKINTNYSEQLYLLCCYHPMEVVMENTIIVSTDNLSIDDKLIKMLKLEAVNKQDNNNNNQVVLIADAVEYITNVLQDRWYSSEEEDRVQLWNNVFTWVARLQDVDRSSATVTQALIDSTSEWLRQLVDSGRLDIFSSLKPGTAAQIIPKAIIQHISRVAIQNLDIYVNFDLDVTCLPTERLIPLLNCLTTPLREKSIFYEGLQQRIQIFSAEADYFPDLFCILSNYAQFFTLETKRVLVRRIRCLLHEDSDEMTEVEIRAKLLQIEELAIRVHVCWENYNSISDNLHRGTVLRDLVFEVDHHELSLNQFLQLIDCAKESDILTVRLAIHILSRGSLWQSHFHVLTKIVANNVVIESLLHFLPNFDAIFTFFAPALAASQAVVLQTSPLFLQLSQTIKTNLVQRLLNEEKLDISCYPTAFQLDVARWPLTVQGFWENFKSSPQDVLLALRVHAFNTIKLNWESRVLHILRPHTNGFLEVNLPAKLRDPFIETFHVIICAALENAARRNCSLEEMSHLLEAAMHVSHNLEKKNDFLKLKMGDLFEENSKYWPLFGSFTEGLRKWAYDEATMFIGQDSVTNNWFLTSKVFWQQVNKLIDENDVIDISKDIGVELLNKVLIIWDLLPHLRLHLAPITRFYCSLNSQPIRIPEANSWTIIKSLQFVLGLVLADFRSCHRETILCALRTLSCKAFGDKAILIKTLTVQVKSEFPPSLSSLSNTTNLSVTLCSKLLQAASEVCTEIPIKEVLDEVMKLVNHLPIISNILSPAICGHDEMAEKSTNVVREMVLRYLSTADLKQDDNRRLVRTICECLDQAGLAQLEAAGWEASDLISLGRQAYECGFYQHAYAYANLAFDKVVSFERNFIAVGGHIPENQDLTTLLVDVYVATNKHESIDSLPDWAQCLGSVRLVALKAQKKWNEVAAHPLSSPEDQVKARWFSGLPFQTQNQEIAYLDALLRYDWNSVSYPKKLTDRWKRLYVLLHVHRLGLDWKATMKKHIVQKIATQTVLDMDSCRELKDLMIIDRYDNELLELEEVSTDSLMLLVVYGFSSMEFLVKTSPESIRKVGNQQIQLVLTLVKRLVQLKAHAACFSLLQTCINLFPPETPLSILKVEQCKLQVDMGDYQVAQYALTEIAKEALPTAIAVEVMCLISTIYWESNRNLPKAILTIRELIKSMPPNSSRQAYRMAYEKLYQLSRQKLLEVEAYLEGTVTKIRRQAVVEWKKQLTSNRLDERKQRMVVQKELACEEDKLKRSEEELQSTVSLVVATGFQLLGYVSPEKPTSPCLNSSDTINVIFPLIDVIFRYDAFKEVVEQFRKYLLSMVPSVWLPVVNHIVSHCFKDGPLSMVIQDMMIKLIAAYPFHVVHSVLSYKYDAEKKGIHHEKVKSLLVSACRRSENSKALQEVLSLMSQIHNMYRQFVWMDLKDKQFFDHVVNEKGDVRYQLKETVHLVANFDMLQRAPLPMIDQPVEEAYDYSTDHFIKWSEIDLVCDKADGMSTPKILKVKGSNGKWYKMVWKKGEDVRQDALVQNLFSVMSELLNSRLPLRTYHVIPLDTQSGIIEFCTGTISLKELLVGGKLRGGLHAIVHPNESICQARQRLVDGMKTDIGTVTMDDFKDILQDVSPVLRHYFYRNYPTVFQWTKMIDNYTLSLAQWSMVCFVVGLGDRHASNVLFDKSTCCFVHIDLGMILEFGKRVLQVPEHVPFRMTRDILDPILLQGTKGILLDHATKAMDIFRNNKEIIYGLTSVFLRETMSNFRDSSDPNRPSFVSASAFGRLKEKLSGTNNTLSPVSPYIQVQQLMDEATNIDHLNRIFAGWLAII